MRTVTDMNGQEWRVDEIIKPRDQLGRSTEIQPGYVQLNLSPPDSEVRNHMGKTLPDWLAEAWLAGRVRVSAERTWR